MGTCATDRRESTPAPRSDHGTALDNSHAAIVLSLILLERIQISISTPYASHFTAVLITHATVLIVYTLKAETNKRQAPHANDSRIHNITQIFTSCWQHAG